MSERKSSLLIQDILDSADKILNYTYNISYSEFTDDSKTIDAVIRNFEIIGEAANRLPEDFRNNYPEIDWHLIRGFRNRIVHNYFGIDFSIVWEIKETFLPKLISTLKSL